MSLLILWFVAFVGLAAFHLTNKPRESDDARGGNASPNHDQARWQHNAMFSHGIGLGTDPLDPFAMARRDDEAGSHDFLTDGESPKLYIGMGIGLYDESPSTFDD